VRADELELAWDDETDRGRSRHRRGRRRAGAGDDGGRGRGGRTTVALILTLVILGALAFGAWYGFSKVSDFFGAPDYNSGGTAEEVVVEVKKNQNATEIGLSLYNNGVVKSQKAFVRAAEDDPRSKQIQPGFYKLRKQMRAADALKLLLDRDASKVVKKVTVPEGKTAKEVLALAAEQTGLPLADLEAAAKDPAALGVPAFWFNRQDGKPGAKGIEGFLYPSTYDFPPTVTAPEVLKAMVAQFLKVATELRFVDRVQAERNISPYEALIVASLAQAEAGIKDDVAKVARVAYNRVYKAKMPLQFDVTTNYWLALNGKDIQHSGKLTDQELKDPNNPYNTTTVLGLPFGPINNPGELALKGAMDPPPGEWLYFVAIDKSGRSEFANTLAEHERHIRTACANGVPLC
jgi:UPF0755 protein